MTSELEKFLRKKESCSTIGKFYCPYCMTWTFEDIFEHINSHNHLISLRFEEDEKWKETEVQTSTNF